MRFHFPRFGGNFFKLHLIATAADAAAEQLVHLCVQKGHAASDCQICKRFLKRPEKQLSTLGAPLSGYVCVCVPLSVSRSFDYLITANHTVICRGGVACSDDYAQRS